MLLSVYALPDYIRSSRATPKALAQPGLNPAGAAMAFIFLLLLVVCAVTGWMQVTERYFGIAWVQDTHTYSSYVLLGLIPLHVIGVLLTSALQRENLIAGMITGRRRQL
jgi:cytochrome b